MAGVKRKESYPFGHLLRDGNNSQPAGVAAHRPRQAELMKSPLPRKTRTASPVAVVGVSDSRHREKHQSKQWRGESLEKELTPPSQNQAKKSGEGRHGITLVSPERKIYETPPWEKGGKAVVREAEGRSEGTSSARTIDVLTAAEVESSDSATAEKREHRTRETTPSGAPSENSTLKMPHRSLSDLEEFGVISLI